ncbi:MAG: cytochrome d ubiquinol oxidase subunit II, partial [Planctomycetia bacterium]|nr:cytochrome d ubiquinol oxidase subunit II [Planctomycetia bacterium]
IFVIVVLFTCFPYGYSHLGVALFVPFHLAVAGIMLRGAAFVFRAHARHVKGQQALPGDQFGAVWGSVFGVASTIAPLLLGVAFGVMTEGGVRLDREGVLEPIPFANWLSPYAVGCGLLALSACAYLAAVYLIAETEGQLQDDFRVRAIVAGTATAGLALLVLAFAWHSATWFFRQLIAIHSWPVLGAGLGCFAASAWAVFGRRSRLARWFAAAEIVLLLLGWGLAQHPYLVYPDITFERAAAPSATIAFMLATLPLGLALVVPSLWMLFRVFKSSVV